MKRLFLALAAVNSLATGLWAIVYPNNLFDLLKIHYPNGVYYPTDGFLWPALGWLSLANALYLAVAALGRATWVGLPLVPWVGRVLSCGLWLWLLGTAHLAPAREPLWWLLAHDAFWLAVLTVVLLAPFLPRRR